MARSRMAKIAVVVVALALLELSCTAVARRQPEVAEGGSGGSGIPAVMTVNGFKKGESGGGPSACDGHFHGDDEMIVALSTEWFDGGRRCHRRIRITRGGQATVVDECDSCRGCRDNIVDSSPAVWRALDLDIDVGEVRVTWSDA